MRLGVQRVALFERPPERTVAHDHRIHHSKLIESKLILAQNAKFLRATHLAVSGLEIAGENFHQRGFARSVRPGNRVAPPSEKGATHFFEQNSGAEAHRDVVKREQDKLIIAWMVVSCTFEKRQFRIVNPVFSATKALCSKKRPPAP